MSSHPTKMAPTSHITEHYREVPNEKTVQEAGQLLVTDEHGKDFAFSSLYENQNDQAQILIVFIRHFFCGACELYIQALCSQLPPSPDYQIIFVGCGGHTLISDYRNRNHIPYPVYADPSRALFKKLDMPETNSPITDGYKSRESGYHDRGFVSIVASSAKNMIASGPSKAMQMGPAGQNGGAILFRGGQARFVHRMRDIGDYLNPEEAKSALGVGQ